MFLILFLRHFCYNNRTDINCSEEHVLFDNVEDLYDEIANDPNNRFYIEVINDANSSLYIDYSQVFFAEMVFSGIGDSYLEINFSEGVYTNQLLEICDISVKISGASSLSLYKLILENVTFDVCERFKLYSWVLSSDFYSLDKFDYIESNRAALDCYKKEQGPKNGFSFFLSTNADSKLFLNGFYMIDNLELSGGVISILFSGTKALVMIQVSENEVSINVLDTLPISVKSISMPNKNYQYTFYLGPLSTLKLISYPKEYVYVPSVTVYTFANCNIESTFNYFPFDIIAIDGTFQISEATCMANTFVSIRLEGGNMRIEGRLSLSIGFLRVAGTSDIYSNHPNVYTINSLDLTETKSVSGFVNATVVIRAKLLINKAQCTFGVLTIDKDSRIEVLFSFYIMPCVKVLSGFDLHLLRKPIRIKFDDILIPSESYISSFVNTTLPLFIAPFMDCWPVPYKFISTHPCFDDGSSILDINVEDYGDLISLALRLEQIPTRFYPTVCYSSNISKCDAGTINVNYDTIKYIGNLIPSETLQLSIIFYEDMINYSDFLELFPKPISVSISTNPLNFLKININEKANRNLLSLSIEKGFFYLTSNQLISIPSFRIGPYSMVETSNLHEMCFDGVSRIITELKYYPYFNFKSNQTVYVNLADTGAAVQYKPNGWNVISPRYNISIGFVNESNSITFLVGDQTNLFLQFDKENTKYYEFKIQILETTNIGLPSIRVYLDESVNKATKKALIVYGDEVIINVVTYSSMMPLDFLAKRVYLNIECQDEWIVNIPVLSLNDLVLVFDYSSGIPRVIVNNLIMVGDSYLNSIIEENPLVEVKSLYVSQNSIAAIRRINLTVSCLIACSQVKFISSNVSLAAFYINFYVGLCYPHIYFKEYDSSPPKSFNVKLFDGKMSFAPPGNQSVYYPIAFQKVLTDKEFYQWEKTILFEPCPLTTDKFSVTPYLLQTDMYLAFLMNWASVPEATISIPVDVSTRNVSIWVYASGITIVGALVILYVSCVKSNKTEYNTIEDTDASLMFT